MGRSSILGTEKAPLEAEGRDERALGPSDSSDTASDRIGTDTMPEADPGEPVDLTLERDVAHHSIETSQDADEGRLGADISVDRSFSADEVGPQGDAREGESRPRPAQGRRGRNLSGEADPD